MICATCDRVWLEGLQDIVRRVILLPLVTGFGYKGYRILLGG